MFKEGPRIYELSDDLEKANPEEVMNEAALANEQLEAKAEKWNHISQRAKEILAEKNFSGIEEVDNLISDRNFREKAMGQWEEKEDEEALAKGLAIRLKSEIETNRTIH